MAGRLDQLAGWPMVGRDEELSFIGDRIDDGSPGVLLTGDVGTGKSRLAREALNGAGGDGQRTEMVLCTPATAGVPFAALSPLLRGGERRALDFDDVVARLRDFDERPVICVDDVDRLDPMSMAVIHQAVGEGLVCLLATVRTGLDRDPDVIALWKDLGLVRIEIQALSRPEVAAMVETGLGGSVDGLAIKQIWSASAGVPLYVHELVAEGLRRRVLVEERGVWTLTGPLPTPATVVDLVRVRLDGLDDQTRAAAEVMGVAGELDAAAFASVAGADAVEQLEEAGIVSAVDDVYRLTHPLFGDVVQRSTSAVRLKRIMSSLADMVEAKGLGHPDDLIRVATWRLESGTESSADVLNDAAHAAYRAGDFNLSRRLAEAAHRGSVLEGSLLLAQILHEMGDHEAAERINQEVDLSGSAPDIIKRAAVQRAVNLFFGMGRGDDALAVLAEAPGGLPYNRAWFLLNMARVGEAGTLLPAEGGTLPFQVTAAWAAALGGKPDTALAVLDRLEQDEDDRNPAPSRFRDFPDLPRSVALLEAGNLAEALAVAERGHQVSIDQHPTFIRCWWLFQLGRIHTDMGRMVTASSFFHRGAVLQESLHQPGLRRWYLGGTAYTLAHTADTASVDLVLGECGVIGDRDERLFTFLTTAAHAWREARRSGPSSVIASLVAAGDEQASTGSLAAARRLWFDAVRMGGAAAVDDRLSGGESDLDRARASLTSAYRDRNSQPAAEVAAFFDERGAALWAAEAWTAVAALAADDGDPRRATAAARSADTARERCEDVDTPGLIRERAGVPLTEREREVVTLAARGMASKEIAEAMFISVRTVNNQIQRAYLKLGVSSRSEAAVALGIDVTQ